MTGINSLVGLNVLSLSRTFLPRAITLTAKGGSTPVHCKILGEEPKPTMNSGLFSRLSQTLKHKPREDGYGQEGETKESREQDKFYFKFSKMLSELFCNK